jgi:hypothetical protein
MNAINQSANYKHGYEIETNSGDVKVYANNRAQAARFAEKAGYTVRSVNFTG